MAIERSRASQTVIDIIGMPLTHAKLKDSLKKAYSAERAAAFAYVGHANSLTASNEKSEVQQIERDEWNHRKHVRHILEEYDIAPSTAYEIRFYLIGKIIGLSCHVIGRFMPFFFAGKLESGNVCEYFVMRHYFNELGITKHDAILHFNRYEIDAKLERPWPTPFSVDEELADDARGFVQAILRWPGASTQGA